MIDLSADTRSGPDPPHLHTKPVHLHAEEIIPISHDHHTERMQYDQKILPAPAGLSTSRPDDVTSIAGVPHLKQPSVDRKRPLSQSRQSTVRRPRPPPLTSKSSSAVVTLSTTPATSATASPTKSSPSPRRWLGKPSTMASLSQGVNPHTAADLLRQVMHRYVKTASSFRLVAVQVVYSVVILQSSLEGRVSHAHQRTGDDVPRHFVPGPGTWHWHLASGILALRPTLSATKRGSFHAPAICSNNITFRTRHSGGNGAALHDDAGYASHLLSPVHWYMQPKKKSRLGHSQ